MWCCELGDEQSKAGITYSARESEICVVLMVILIVIVSASALVSEAYSAQLLMEFAIVAGLSAIAIAILHLAKVLQETR